MSEEEAPITRDEILGLLAAIAKDRQIALRDRLDAIRIHSRILGFKLSEADKRSLILALANGGTDRPIISH